LVITASLAVCWAILASSSIKELVACALDAVEVVVDEGVGLVVGFGAGAGAIQLQNEAILA
jgi:hypothetical protein